MVATKYGFREGPGTPPYSAQDIDEAVTRSLQKMQTDYIDILQVSWDKFWLVLVKYCLKLKYVKPILKKVGTHRRSNDDIDRKSNAVNDFVIYLLNDLRIIQYMLPLIWLIPTFWFQIHFPAFIKDYDETIKELNRQIALGRIKHYGVSNFGPKNMSQFLGAGAKPISNQVQ